MLDCRVGSRAAVSPQGAANWWHEVSTCSSMVDGSSTRSELAALSVVKKPPPCRATVKHRPLWRFHKHILSSLQNPSRWKAMSEEALKSVCAPGTTTSLPPLPPLCASSLDPAATSNQLELELRFLVSEHRRVKCNTGLKLFALHRSRAARPLLACWCASYRTRASPTASICAGGLWSPNLDEEMPKAKSSLVEWTLHDTPVIFDLSFTVELKCRTRDSGSYKTCRSPPQRGWHSVKELGHLVVKLCRWQLAYWAHSQNEYTEEYNHLFHGDVY